MSASDSGGKGNSRCRSHGRNPSGVNFSLSILMVTAWAIARFNPLNPHRICFLLESVWFILVALGPALRIARGGNWWWLIFIGFTQSLAKAAFGQYQRFAGTVHPATAS